MGRKPKLTAQDRDRALARERMRLLRAGRSTAPDRAYHVALAQLRDKHREEFERLRECALRDLETGRRTL